MQNQDVLLARAHDAGQPSEDRRRSSVIVAGREDDAIDGDVPPPTPVSRRYPYVAECEALAEEIKAANAALIHGMRTTVDKAILAREPGELLATMTEPMRKDALKLAPLVRAWLNGLTDRAQR